MTSHHVYVCTTPVQLRKAYSPNCKACQKPLTPKQLRPKEIAKWGYKCRSCQKHHKTHQRPHKLISPQRLRLLLVAQEAQYRALQTQVWMQRFHQHFQILPGLQRGDRLPWGQAAQWRSLSIVDVVGTISQVATNTKDFTLAKETVLQKTPLRISHSGIPTGYHYTYDSGVERFFGVQPLQAL